MSPSATRTPAQAQPSPRVAALTAVVASHLARGTPGLQRPAQRIRQLAPLLGLPTDAKTLSVLALALRAHGFRRGGGCPRRWWPPAADLDPYAHLFAL